MNLKALQNELKLAEKGDKIARKVVRLALAPSEEDSAEEIAGKMLVFHNLFFAETMKYDDAPFHLEIDLAYAKQIESLLKNGAPKWRGIVVVGFRESAKTSRVKMCETYCSLYVPEFSDYVQIASEDGGSSTQFTMDMWNVFGVSKIPNYFGEIIAEAREKKKGNQTMSKFTTSTGVTYSASSARKSKRGTAAIEVSESGGIAVKRPKRAIFDDIENETTLRSYQVTEHVASVLSASIDGLDQVCGWFLLLGNYLSLRGNVAKYVSKAGEDEKILLINIPILDGLGNPTWPAKYVRTDAEELSDPSKRSVEGIERNSDNFQTEFMNNPNRSSVYFEEKIFKNIPDAGLVPETARDSDGYLEIEAPEIGETYVMANDAGKGTGRDKSAFVVWKISGIRYVEVANFQSNKLSPEDFAGFSVQIARKYNNALVIPENNFPGNEVIAFMKPVYGNIFVSETKMDEKGKETKVYGISTNLKTKPEMFLNAKRLMKDSLFVVNSKALHSQFGEYPKEDVLLVRQDGGGGHFDLLMAAVIGLWKAGSVAAGSSQYDDEAAVDAALKKRLDKVFKKKDNYR